jgi:hypothetical protein
MLVKRQARSGRKQPEAAFIGWEGVVRTTAGEGCLYHVYDIWVKYRGIFLGVGGWIRHGGKGPYGGRWFWEPSLLIRLLSGLTEDDVLEESENEASTELVVNNKKTKWGGRASPIGQCLLPLQTVAGISHRKQMRK